MINSEDLQRFLKLRENLFYQIKKVLEVDGHHKSYEGVFNIIMPGYFEEEFEDAWEIILNLYLIAPSGRQHHWIGKTFKEVLDKAEHDIRRWIEWEDLKLKNKEPDEYYLCNDNWFYCRSK